MGALLTIEQTGTLMLDATENLCVIEPILLDYKIRKKQDRSATDA